MLNVTEAEARDKQLGDYVSGCYGQDKGLEGTGDRSNTAGLC